MNKKRLFKKNWTVQMDKWETISGYGMEKENFKIFTL